MSDTGKGTMARRQRKQQEIPGTEQPERPEIEEPAEDLRAITGELALLNERKRNAQRTLLEAMVAAGIKEHRYVDSDGTARRARLKETPKVQVERVKMPKETESASADGDDGDVEVS